MDLSRFGKLTVSGLSTLSSGINVTQTETLTHYLSLVTTITGATSGTTFTGTTINATNITANDLTATTFSITTLSGVSGVFPNTVIATTHNYRRNRRIYSGCWSKWCC